MPVQSCVFHTHVWGHVRERAQHVLEVSAGSSSLIKQQSLQHKLQSSGTAHQFTVVQGAMGATYLDVDCCRSA